MKKFACLLLCILMVSPALGKLTLYVSASAKPGGDGSLQHPYYSLRDAFTMVCQSRELDVTIYLRGGTYRLDRPLMILSDNTGNKHLTLASYPGEQAVISGGRMLHIRWSRGEKGFWQAKVEGPDFDQLFINGHQRPLARYPNYRVGVIMNGTAADACSAERIKKWANPVGGFLHAMHAGQWGDMHYEVIGRTDNELKWRGGFQNNRPSAAHKQYRFVENIREELDTAGEWFLDKAQHLLYYCPMPGEDIRKARIEVSQIESLIMLMGTPQHPLRHITLRGLTFQHTLRTFMSTYVPLMRSDWSIHRGAAVFLKATEDCCIEDCDFTQLGGNAVFLSDYNKGDIIRHNYIHHIGASAICVVGDTSAVRLHLSNYNQSTPLTHIDHTAGPANERYPRQCIIDDNLIHHIGETEKQVAGVEIQIAESITVSHNSIYQVPRAAINVGDGAFGGHIIRDNDAFETVLETSDHGSFNSWGRDRYWHPNRSTMDTLVLRHPDLILLDCRSVTQIIHNRFRCDHGWDIDLDDGSSNYLIRDNVCLSGGIKLREGFYRTVEGNLMVNCTFHPHVWFKDSHDRFIHNIVMTDYRPIGINYWGEQVDSNFFASPAALQVAQSRSTDEHSLSGPLAFRDAAHGDYTLPTNCPAFHIGYRNVAMDNFGVYSARLRRLTRHPVFPQIHYAGSTAQAKPFTWLGVRLHAIVSIEERSAYGLTDNDALVVEDIGTSEWAKGLDLHRGDAIRKVNGLTVSSGNHLPNQVTSLLVLRNQQELLLKYNLTK